MVNSRLRIIPGTYGTMRKHPSFCSCPRLLLPKSSLFPVPHTRIMAAPSLLPGGESPVTQITWKKHPLPVITFICQTTVKTAYSSRASRAEWINRLIYSPSGTLYSNENERAAVTCTITWMNIRDIKLNERLQIQKSA